MLGLGEETEVKVVVGSIFWAFLRLRKSKSREMSARGYAVQSVCHHLSFLLPKAADRTARWRHTQILYCSNDRQQHPMPWCQKSFGWNLSVWSEHVDKLLPLATQKCLSYFSYHRFAFVDTVQKVDLTNVWIAEACCTTVCYFSSSARGRCWHAEKDIHGWIRMIL